MDARTVKELHTELVAAVSEVLKRHGYAKGKSSFRYDDDSAHFRVELLFGSDDAAFAREQKYSKDYIRFVELSPGSGGSVEWLGRKLHLSGKEFVFVGLDMTRRTPSRFIIRRVADGNQFRTTWEVIKRSFTV